MKRRAGILIAEGRAGESAMARKGTLGNLPLPRVEASIEEKMRAGRAAKGIGSGGKLLCDAWTWEGPPTPVSDAHVHVGLELGLVISGEIAMYLGKTRVTCRPGNVWLCGMWEPHGWTINERGTRHVTFVFPPDVISVEGDSGPFLELFAARADLRPRVTDGEVRARVRAIGEDIEREVTSQGPFWQSAVRFDLLRVLCELARTRPGSSQSGTLSARPDHLGILERIMPAIHLVQGNCERRVTTTEAAASCGLSRRTFCSMFRRAMGTTFGQFGLRLRLAHAAHSLLNSDSTVAAITEAIGFEDVSHLSKAFAKHYGCTPTQYRRRRLRGGSPGVRGDIE